jgi:hypothetical protein
MDTAAPSRDHRRMGRGRPDWMRTERGGFLDRVSDKIEAVVEAPYTLAGRGRPVTMTARRRLMAEGVPGTAVVVKPPRRFRGGPSSLAWQRFGVRVEIPGREPYEATTLQEIGQHEFDHLQQGAVVPCRVDPDEPSSVLLIVDGDNALTGTVDSRQILAAGRPGRARVRAVRLLDVTAPGSGDPVAMLSLEVHEEGVAPWGLEGPYRIPPEHAALAVPDAWLAIGIVGDHDPDGVAVNWDASDPPPP